ncbi:MAG: hypothetical protein CVT64_05655 [Actinobacteria bacterium HGW-Actinobacteria-4]|nr:MAG: hypothetical protein CVT64_05655 [Actinobacteria bacterium HGW-Actinobacteria-4]
MKNVTIYALVGLAAAVTLTACSPTDPDPSDGPGTPAPVVTVVVTAEPSAGPVEPVAPSADYGFTFFEEAQIGATWDQMSAQLNMPVAGIEECPWFGAVWNTEIATTYAFTDSRDTSNGVSFFYTNRFLAADGAPFPRNAEGVGVGSTQAAVLAAHPSGVVGTWEDLGAGTLTTITVEDPDSDSKYVFAISDGSAVVDLLQWGPGAGTQWSHLCGGF